MSNGNGPEWGTDWQVTDRPPAPSPTTRGQPPRETYSESLTNAVAQLDGKPSLDVQVGGDHYKHRGIQPVEYCMANNIGFMEGSVIKYVTRWRDKGGVVDLLKARHFLDMLIEAQPE